MCCTSIRDSCYSSLSPIAPLYWRMLLGVSNIVEFWYVFLRKRCRNDYAPSVRLNPCLCGILAKIRLISDFGGLLINNPAPGYALQPWLKIIGKEIQAQSGNNTDSKSCAKHWRYNSLVIILYYHFWFCLYRVLKIEIYAAFTSIHSLYSQEQLFHRYVLINIHSYGVASKQLYCTGVKAT